MSGLLGHVRSRVYIRKSLQVPSFAIPHHVLLSDSPNENLSDTVFATAPTMVGLVDPRNGAYCSITCRDAVRSA